MAYCPKCGNQVEENMTFCPRCGASLKAEAPVRAMRRDEKAEKQEKGEPEKGEKHEKGEYGFIGWLIGGLILMVAGAIAFLNVHYNFVNTALGWALFLLVIGVIIIVVAVYFAMTAKKRSPTPV